MFHCSLVLESGKNRSAGLNGKQIEDAVRDRRSGGGDCLYDSGDLREEVLFGELSGAVIVEEMEMACAVNQGCIGVAVAVEISPDKLTDAPRRRAKRYEWAESVPSPLLRSDVTGRPLADPKTHVEVPVGFDVNGPCACVVCISDCFLRA